ncbi:MAG: sulfatase-like hydrolase/transferase [Clostridiales bacterium]|nr:sulfatase-like hydrolase/transferase [Clostridiales bacterium]
MKQANILFIMADDLGHWSLGCAGNQDAITPHIDRLAAEGMQLKRFYAASPVCSPARASLLTGQMPSYHGVADWIRAGNISAHGDSACQYLKGQKAYTQHLQEAGYVCGLSGKWHLGDSQTPQQGFAHWYAHQSGGGPYYGAPMIKNGELIAEPGYVTDAITKDAIQFIQTQSGCGQPFYLQVAYTAPHTPWTGKNHPQEYLDLYQDCAFDSCPQVAPHPDQIAYPMFQEDRHAMLSGYFAAITAMDAGIGRIYDALKANGLLEDTLIVFTSDNGFNCGHHGIWGKGNGTWPLNLYESSVRVPFIVRYPKLVPQNTHSAAVIGAYDWFATVLALTSITSPKPPAISRDFTDILMGKNSRDTQEAFVADEYGGTRMIIKGNLKYIKRYHDNTRLLFDLKNDPDERDNLFHQADPAIIDALDLALETWFLQHSRPEADACLAGVRGFGQVKMSGKDGYPKDAFIQNITD